MKGVFSKTPVKALDRIPPTVGLNGIFYSSLLEIVATIEIEDVRVVIWDVGGHVLFLLVLEFQKSMRSMWSKYYRDCHGVIFLIDSSDPDRFKEVKDELRMCFAVVFICRRFGIEHRFGRSSYSDLCQ